MNIRTLKQVKDFIRGGSYAWPGGYPLFFITATGPLSIKAAHENFYQVAHAHIFDSDPDWKIIGVEINWENHALRCSHTNEPIEAAYAEVVED